MNTSVNVPGANADNTVYGGSYSSMASQGTPDSEETDYNNPSNEQTELNESASTQNPNANSNPAANSNPITPNAPGAGANGPIATSWMSQRGDTVFEHAVRSAGKRKLSWKKVTQGGVTGIVLGTAAVLLSSHKGASDGDVVEPTDDGDASGELILGVHPEETGDSSLASLVDSEVSWASGVNDDMSFAEAFAAAREDVGPGGVFEWRGQLYGTYYGEEWDNMSSEERDEYNNHFAWSGDSHSPSEEEINVIDTVDEHDPATIAENHSGDDVNEEVLPVDTDDDEIEILGVYHDDETGATFGNVMVDGQEYVLIDVESDGEIDYIAADFDGDGQISADEIIDLTVETPDDDLEYAQEVTIEDFEEDVQLADDLNEEMFEEDSYDADDSLLAEDDFGSDDSLTDDNLFDDDLI